MTKRRQYTWLALVGVAVLLAVVLIHRQKTSGRVTQPTSITVDVVTPTTTTLRREVEVFGSLAPKTTTELRNEIPGRVVRVNVKDWDRVSANDVLVELDPTDARLTLGRAEAGVKMARAQLLKARVDFTQAQREWNRAQRLKEAGLITGKELDDRQSGLEASRALVGLGEATVVQAESQAAEARHNLEKAVIRAPIDGTVCQRSIDVGDYVKDGSPLFMVVDSHLLDFTASVAAADLVRVGEGQPLTFSVDGFPNQTFQGVIKRVNPMVSHSDRSGKIQAEVANPDGVLKGGVYARGRVTIEERANVLTLPRTVLNNWDLQKNTARVFVVDDQGLAQVRTVTTGLSSEDVVEVTSGVGSSDQVVFRGGFNLREGDRVQVSEKGRKG
ncbi:MAG TPA: efflux RND transporter periplasmic adaptor subunit [Syntrophobacteraceae bacterium]|nr:efflux RND transporter periplasmic adaptor subunit [Syntrophobacteraceae bacterium]